MTIRQLTHHDLAALLQLYKHLHTDENILSPATIDAIWAATCHNKNIFYFGYFVEEQLISSCQLVLVANFTRGGKPYALIENVVTHQLYRQQGLGKKLLQYVLQQAWQQNCYKVMLITGRQEENVHQFYKKLRFKSEGKTAYVAKPGE